MRVHPDDHPRCRAVHAVLRTPVDGRGGDGGIDILLTRPDGRTTIFQPKHFPGGFSGKHNARRRQITNSLRTALKHHPDEWVLVVPCTLTLPDYDFIGMLNRATTTRPSRCGTAPASTNC